MNVKALKSYLETLPDEAIILTYAGYDRYASPEGVEQCLAGKDPKDNDDEVWLESDFNPYNNKQRKIWEGMEKYPVVIID